MQGLPPALPAAAPDSLAMPYLPGLYRKGRGQDPGDMWGPLGNGPFGGKRVTLFGTPSEVIWDTALPAGS